MPAATAERGAQTVRRATRALKLIASQPGSAMRLVDFARSMDLDRSTAHRLLKALAADGMLTQDPVTRRYGLGSTLFELGLAAAHQFNLRDICQPILTRLSEKTGDTSFLFVRSGDDAVCIARVQGPFPIQTPAVPVGGRQPLGVNAGGLALLAALPAKEVEGILNTIGPRLDVYGQLDTDMLRQHWQRARDSGYALIGNYAVPGVTALGLPVRRGSGAAIAAITLAAISSRMSEQRVSEILPTLHVAVNELTAALGN